MVQRASWLREIGPPGEQELGEGWWEEVTCEKEESHER